MPPTSQPSPQDLETQVLTVVDALVSELQGDDAGQTAGPHDSLERELGISSLERVELLLRLERAFDIRLGDAAMAEADTPADLIALVRAASPATRDTLPEAATASGRVVPAAASATTLIDALAWHAERTPERVHIHLREDDGTQTPLTYGDLWTRSLEVATGLSARGVRHRDTVAIMLRTEVAFFTAFLGTLMAGGVPVPLYPPFRLDRIEEYARRQVGILTNADAHILVTFAEIARVAALLIRQAPSLATVVTVDELADPGRTRAGLPRPSGADPALIQYTSGSTGQPKGVLLSHDNLLSNIRAIQQGLDLGSDDVGVSWLPLYHDMGLIGSWLGTMYVGIPLVLMSPLAFLARPARWLQTLHSRRGTLSPAPNFAFDLCVHRVTDDEIEGLDLSSVRVLLNGSEAVVPETLERFHDRFAPYGLRRDALLPVYGLAECSVGLATPPIGRPPRVDRVTRLALQERGIAAAAPDDDPSALKYVSCGRALPDHALRVVGPTGTPVGEREEGRVQFRGPSATAGYYRNPEATRELIGTDGWLETGDLGYLAGSELFLTGRRKDLIIKGGRNIHPHEAEAVAGGVEGVRKGCVAAFGVRNPDRGTERLVIVAETRRTAGPDRDRIRATVIERITDGLGLPPDTVVLSGPGTVLKTSSGKIRRAATREAYLAGRLERGRASVAGQWLRVVARAAVGRAVSGLHLAGRFAFTLYVGTLLLTTAPLVWGLLTVGPRGSWVDRLIGGWCRALFALAGCRVRVSGNTRLADVGPAVNVGNHASYLDPVLVMATLPGRRRFATKRGLSRYPFLGAAIRKGEHIPIEKAELSQRIEGASAILEPLRAGQSLFVFPEGTFDATPRLLPFRLGAFRAAVETGRPVVPVAIRGTRHILPAFAWLLRPGRITVTIGEPLRPEGTDWREIVRLRDEARAFISEHCEEP